MRSTAVNMVGDMLASGGSVYEGDEDFVLVGEALPFSLKLVETLIAESPEHRGLLLTASRGYTTYAYAYVHFDADVALQGNLEEARALRARATKLYLRAHRYARRALDVAYPKVSDKLRQHPVEALQVVVGGPNDQDVANLYWLAASLGLAISVSKNDPALLARLPEVEALLDKAMTLNESWDGGALHEFAITLAAARSMGTGAQALPEHFERALDLSAGRRASLFVGYAEATAIRKQDRNTFTDLLEQALAVDLDAYPEYRLANAIAQRRARWLLTRTDELFLE